MLLSAARSSTVPYLFVTAISGALPRCPWSPYLLLCFMCTFRLIYRNLITLMTLLVPCPVVSCPFLSYSRRLLHSLVLGMNLDAALVIVGSPKTSSLCVGIFICFSFFFSSVCLFVLFFCHLFTVLGGLVADHKQRSSFETNITEPQKPLLSLFALHVHHVTSPWSHCP